MKSEGWRVNDKVQMCQKYLRDQRLDDGHNVTAANILDESGANGALREAYVERGESWTATTVGIKSQETRRYLASAAGPQ